MAEAAFNTIAEVQRLRDAGFEQTQAEAITLSIHSGVTGGVATKADLEVQSAETRAEIAEVRTEIAEVRTEIAALDKKIEVQGATLEAKIDKQGATLEKQIIALDKKIEVQGGELRGEIATAKFDLTWRLLAGIAAVNGIMFAALRYLPPPG